MLMAEEPTAEEVEMDSMFSKADYPTLIEIENAREP